MDYQDFRVRLNDAGFQSADSPFNRMLFTQAWHESGDFTNRHTIDHNNIFGMGASRQRTKYWDYEYSGDGRQMAGYFSLAAAIQDRMDWEAVLMDIGDMPQSFEVLELQRYAEALHTANYNTNPDYPRRLVRDYQKLFGNSEAVDDEFEEQIIPKLKIPYGKIVIACAGALAFYFYNKNKKNK